MPEPGMGSGGARSGAGMGGGGRQDRDEPGLGTLLSGESVGSVLGRDPRSGGKVGGHYSYERGRWMGGTSPKKTSPEESFSAAVAPVAKPDTSKTTFYLDETPALVEQKVAAVPAVKNPFKDLVAETNTEKQSRLNQNDAMRQQNALTQTSMMAGADYSGVTAAAERAKTMGATMGGGPSYDPLVTGEEQLTEPDYQTEMEASSWPLQLTNYMRSTRLDPLTGKIVQGYKNPVWKPEFSKWSDARKKDWMAGFDKTLGESGKYAEIKADWEQKATQEEQQVIWDKVSYLMDKTLSKENLEKLYDSGYNMTQLTSIVNPANAGVIRDVIRHGIATNKYGLTKMTGYETFKSGQEWSDYKNNYAAAKFARTLKPGQDFDDEWAAVVIQERMNPGSTGITIDWKAGTENDPTVTQVLEGWMKSFMDKLSGMQGVGAKKMTGMITQAEGGG